MPSKSLSEIKFAVVDLLFDEFGLDGQEQVDQVESCKSFEEVQGRVAAFMKMPFIASQPGLAAKMQKALV